MHTSHTLLIMKPRDIVNLAAIALFQFGTFSGAFAMHSHPSDFLIQRRNPTLTPKGCYSSPGQGASTNGAGIDIYQTSSSCQNACIAVGMPVSAITGGNDCYCASALPSDSDMVDQSECSTPCVGYGSQSCGGDGVYQVWLTGLNDNVGTTDGSSDSGPVDASGSLSSASAPPPPAPTSVIVLKPTKASTVIHTSVAKPTTIIKNQQTIVQTIQAPTTVAASTGSSSTNNDGVHSSGSSTGSTVGIAVGVVVGLVVLGAIVAFAVFYLRRRRRMKNAENGHARADSLNAFVAGGSTHNAPVGPDARLDPRVMVERRRMSNGSVFADNQDYSRKILKVANPDE